MSKVKFSNTNKASPQAGWSKKTITGRIRVKISNIKFFKIERRRRRFRSFQVSRNRFHVISSKNTLADRHLANQCLVDTAIAVNLRDSQLFEKYLFYKVSTKCLPATSLFNSRLVERNLFDQIAVCQMFVDQKTWSRGTGRKRI